MSTRTYYIVSRERRAGRTLYFAQIVDVWGRKEIRDGWVELVSLATKFAHYEMALRTAKEHQASVGVYEE